ncbi:hypothetical protein ACPPVU_10245 [Mucilaginibacter sp. McL0603]|uniref:hypothetical protein n=1 Tax=Mucilaginibacter sp. McL0603 TaxID=3415670 RepID=UPI003CF77F42
MKRYLYFIIPAIAFVLNGCKKDVTNNVTVPIVPSVTVQSVNYPSFANSPWSNVAGGTVLFKFDLLNASNAVVSSYKDSIDVKNIGNYDKTLDKGTYNIYLSSKDQTSVADTFIRFNAKVSAYSVTDKQALSFTATTTDGLITIGQSFVQSNTVPTFKSDSNSTVYKFGLINGFYYLYVKGGTKGAITFTSKGGNQVITKSLSVVTLNQYNLEVQTNRGSLQVVFSPFAYNQVDVNSSTLLTVNLNPNYYSMYSSTYFVVTDENGNVLNSVKYILGTSTFKISSLQPFEKTRFNFFEIDIPQDPNTTPQLTGYLQVRKGSTYTVNPNYLPQTQSKAINLHLKNSTGFDLLNVSTDQFSGFINNLSDSTNIKSSYYADNKLWVQILKNNQYSYNFFTMPVGATDYNVDLSQLTKTPLTKTITAPGNNFQVEVCAKPDSNYSNFYNFGFTRSQYNQLNIYYPSETYEEYDVLMDYSVGSLNYRILTSGKTIPDQAATFGASFTVAGSTLADFVPSCTGTFDYYHANFLNLNAGSRLQVDLYSPSAANYTNIKLPDFSKYLGVQSIDLSKLALKSFELDQYDGFSELNFYPGNSAFLNSPHYNSKYVMQSY